MRTVRRVLTRQPWRDEARGQAHRGPGSASYAHDLRLAGQIAGAEITTLPVKPEPTPRVLQPSLG
jgi:hypothetical protein